MEGKEDEGEEKQSTKQPVQGEKEDNEGERGVTEKREEQVIKTKTVATSKTKAKSKTKTKAMTRTKALEKTKEKAKTKIKTNTKIKDNVKDKDHQDQVEQVEGGEGSLEGEKGSSRLRGKSKAGLILEQTLLDPIAAAVNR